MPKFGNRSKKSLVTIIDYGQLILNEAIKVYDFSILCGHRTPDRQMELYKKGRSFNKQGRLVIIEKRKVVTYCDGYNKLSDHQENPSTVFDIVPYPIDWKNINRFYELAGVIKAVAYNLNIKIKWGGEWKKLKDYPHFKVIKN